MNPVRFVVLCLAVATTVSPAAAEDVADAQLAYAYEVFLSEDPDGALSADIWLKLGNVRLRQLRHADAREAYRRVVDLAGDEASVETMLAGRLGIGLSYSGEERYEDAVRELTVAVDQSRDAPLRGNLVAIYRELANIGLHTEDYVSVIRYAETARGAYDTMGYWEDEAVMLLVIGVAHAETGALEDAATALHRSYDLFTERGAGDVDHRAQATRVARIARAYGINDKRW